MHENKQVNEIHHNYKQAKQTKTDHRIPPVMLLDTPCVYLTRAGPPFSFNTLDTFAVGSYITRSSLTQ